MGSSKRIKIRLDISIPTDGSSVEVVSTQQQDCEQICHPGTGKFGVASVIKAPLAGQPYPVKVTGGSTTGVICAYGNAPASGNNYPATVEGSCNGGATVSGTVDQNDGSWQLDSIPNAECGGSGPDPSNDLTVCFYDELGNPVGGNYSTTFIGECSDETYCGSGNSGQSSMEIARSSAAMHVPLSYEVEANGFSSELSVFGGKWSLQVDTGNDNDNLSVWRDGGGEATLELILCKKTGKAKLVFSTSGATVITYRIDQGWNPMNVAEFADVSSRAVPPGASIPGVVVVTPK